MKKLFDILKLLFAKNNVQIEKTPINEQNEKKVEQAMDKEEQSELEKIIPIYNSPISFNEDHSDPEEITVIEAIKEDIPTSKNVYELINLIENIKIVRKIDKVFFHCTATSQNTTVASILRYWKETLGWDSPGYHIIVLQDGSWTLLQDFNKPTNGVKGHNANSLHFSYIGGIDSKGRPLDNRTDNQKKIFESIYILIKNKIQNVKFHGHNEFSNKACPSYDVQEWIKTL